MVAFSKVETIALDPNFHSESMTITKLLLTKSQKTFVLLETGYLFVVLFCLHSVKSANCSTNSPEYCQKHYLVVYL